MNGEKRHKGLEIIIYKSLIIAAGIMTVIVLMAIADDYGLLVLGAAFAFVPVIFLAFVAILVISVVGLVMCSWLLIRHLLLWYAYLFTLVLFLELIVPAKLSNFIMALGVVLLLILPVIWVRNASRS